MDKILVAQLSRIETALTALTDSIVAYRPSTAAAEALAEADVELEGGLQILAQHHANHAEILRLQQVVEQQDQQILNSLKALVDVRQQLMDVPRILPPHAKQRQKVSVDELIAFGTRIARAKPRQAAPQDEGLAMNALEPEVRQSLDPWAGIPRPPWPSEEVIRRSALAASQNTVVANEHAMEVDIMQEPTSESQQAPSVPLEIVSGPQPAIRQEPTVFGGLDLYDPDEE